MNSLLKYFSYNWIEIIRNNVKNNGCKVVDVNQLVKITSLILKKELCAIAFVVIIFLINYFNLVEVYQASYSHVFFYILRDNFSMLVIWFSILSILPIVSAIFIKCNLKNKYYLILDIFYLFSNVFNLLMIAYFITCFISSVVLGIIGIIDLIITVIINFNIIIEINETYLGL